MILYLLFLKRQNKVRYFFAIIYVILFLLLFVMFQQLQSIRRRRILLSSKPLTESSQAMTWIWALES